MKLQAWWDGACSNGKICSTIKVSHTHTCTPNVKTDQQDLPKKTACWDTPPPLSSPLYAAYKHGLFKYLAARRITIPVLTPTQIRARDNNTDDDVVAAARGRFVPPQEQPECIAGGTLMPFQMEGFQWLLYKYFKRESCILADDMGLGKTYVFFFFFFSVKCGLHAYLLAVCRSPLCWVI